MKSWLSWLVRFFSLCFSLILAGIAILQYAKGEDTSHTLGVAILLAVWSLIIFLQYEEID